MDDLERIRIYESERRVAHLVDIPWHTMGTVTDEFITGPSGSKLEATTRLGQELRPPSDSREVFVVHGRNDAARNALFEFLRAIDLHPLEWSEVGQATGKASPYIGEILDVAFAQAHAVVVLFTPDDEARLREPFRWDEDPTYEAELTGQARPNVLFEAGMAMAWAPGRTVLVEIGTLRPFTDIAGLHIIRLDGSSERRQELAQRLRTAGCPVNLDGTAWHSAGDFEDALSIISQMVSPSAVEPDPTTSRDSQLSEDAAKLLGEAAKDNDGTILVLRTQGGSTYRTNGNHFGEMGQPRSEARWKAAANELLELGLIEDQQGQDKARHS